MRAHLIPQLGLIRSMRAALPITVVLTLSVGGCGGADCPDRPPTRPVGIPIGVTYVGGDEQQRAELSWFVNTLRAGDVVGVANRELGVPGLAKAQWLVDHYATAAKGSLRIRVNEYAGDLGQAPVCITLVSVHDHVFVGLGSTSLSSPWQMVYPSVPGAGERLPDPSGASCV